MRSRLPLFDALAAPLTVSAKAPRYVATPTHGGVDTILKRAPSRNAVERGLTSVRDTVRVRTHAARKHTHRVIVAALGLVFGAAVLAEPAHAYPDWRAPGRLGGRAGGRVALSAGGGL